MAARIAALQEAHRKRHELTVDRVLKRFEEIAFAKTFHELELHNKFKWQFFTSDSRVMAGMTLAGTPGVAQTIANEEDS